jgi:hypothetical protein
VRQGGLAHAGHILDQEMSARQQADDGEFNDSRLAFNDLRDIVL